ncbi:MAG: PilZ domain-containing protein [Candidatus Omnitrophica bacterium]|jgi:hypothetical protein|nr:PilZ domain-containing protein [Candidatus Omnitrophota bacterium]
MQRPKIERRRQPRVEEKIPLKIKDEGFDAISVTKNISCSGVFCQVDGYFPLLSKVKIVLLLPSEEKSKAHPVHIDGVVVRSEPVKNSPDLNCRNIGIFFNKMKKQDQNRISGYINSILAKRMVIIN